MENDLQRKKDTAKVVYLSITFAPLQNSHALKIWQLLRYNKIHL